MSVLESFKSNVPQKESWQRSETTIKKVKLVCALHTFSSLCTLIISAITVLITLQLLAKGREVIWRCRQSPLLSKHVTKHILEIWPVIMTHHWIFPFCYEIYTKILFICNINTFNQAQTIVTMNTKFCPSLGVSVGSCNLLHAERSGWQKLYCSAIQSYCSLEESLPVVWKSQAESDAFEGNHPFHPNVAKRLSRREHNRLFS